MSINLQPLQRYSGDDPPKVRAYERDCSDAEKISKYIDAKIVALKDDQRTMLTYGKIAVATGIAEKRVHKYCLQLDSATDNSIEIWK